MTASLLEMNETIFDKDTAKQKEIDLLLNRTSWAAREVAPVVRAQVSDDFLIRKLSSFEVHARECKFSIRDRDNVQLVRYASTATTRTINGKDEAHKTTWTTHHGHQDLYSYTIYVNVPSAEKGDTHLLFSVAAVDDTTPVAGCDKITPYQFGLVFAGVKRSYEKCYFKNTKWMPWPKPEANLAEWLKTQIHVHLMCFLEEAMGDEMFRPRPNNRSIKDFIFPEWSDV